MELEKLKQKYQKEWEECKGDEKLFLEIVRAKERLKRVKEKIKAKDEQERKRRTRALILFATEFISDKVEIAEMYMKYKKLIGKEGKEQIDYTKYILEEIQKAKERKAQNSGTPGSSGSIKQ